MVSPECQKRDTLVSARMSGGFRTSRAPFRLKAGLQSIKYATRATQPVAQAPMLACQIRIIGLVDTAGTAGRSRPSRSCGSSRCNSPGNCYSEARSASTCCSSGRIQTRSRGRYKQARCSCNPRRHHPRCSPSITRPRTETPIKVTFSRSAPHLFVIQLTLRYSIVHCVLLYSYREESLHDPEPSRHPVLTVACSLTG